MKTFDCNGLEVSPNKYISLSYYIGNSWCPPSNCIIYILEQKNINYMPSSDSILERLQIPLLIDFANRHNNQCTLSVLDSIHSASRLIQEFLEASSKAYSYGIKNNVIERVYFFFPWVRCFQRDAGMEVTFFTLVEYRNSKRVFKIIKLIPNVLPPQVSLSDYLNCVWEASIPTIQITTDIYQYNPDKSPCSPYETKVVYNSILKYFLKENFGQEFPIDTALIGLSGIGQLLTSDDMKETPVSRKLKEKTIYVSISPSVLDNYFSCCRKAFEALASMEVYRDILISYRNLCKKHRLISTQQLTKEAFENYLFAFSRKKAIRLDVSLEESIREKTTSDILKFVSTTLAKSFAELFSPN